MLIAPLSQSGYNTGDAGVPGTVKQAAEAMGEAAVRIALNRLRTGERLKRPDSDFPLAEDGHSIGVPHARTDPAPKWQRRGALAGE